MAISVFKILGFRPLKFQKIDFFWKMDPKIKHLQYFLKKTVTYVIQLLVVYQCTKFKVNSSIFDPPNEVVFVSEIIPIMMSYFKCDFL